MRNTPLCCPICLLHGIENFLEEQSQGVQCVQGHQFDRARTGYMHMLPVQSKNSKSPGDTPASLQARRQFLEAGYYAPLADAIVSVLATFLPTSTPIDTTHVVDTGCGEGYYTRYIQKHLHKTGVHVWGTDIAKTAIQMAAKATRLAAPTQDANAAALHWLVASSAALPFATHAVGAVLSIFSPVFAAEYARILKPEGVLIVVKPLPEHVHSLRAALFDTVTSSRALQDDVEMQRHFNCVHRQAVHVDWVLPLADLQQLVAMTPYAYKAKAERLQALFNVGATQPFITQAAFDVTVWQRIKSE